MSRTAVPYSIKYILRQNDTHVFISSVILQPQILVWAFYIKLKATGTSILCCYKKDSMTDFINNVDFTSLTESCSYSVSNCTPTLQTDTGTTGNTETSFLFYAQISDNCTESSKWLAHYEAPVPTLLHGHISGLFIQ